MLCIPHVSLGEAAVMKILPDFPSSFMYRLGGRREMTRSPVLAYIPHVPVSRQEHTVHLQTGYILEQTASLLIITWTKGVNKDLGTPGSAVVPSLTPRQGSQTLSLYREEN